MTTRGNRKLVNIYIDEKLWKAAKKAAVDDDMTAQAWVEAALAMRLYFISVGRLGELIREVPKVRGEVAK